MGKRKIGTTLDITGDGRQALLGSFNGNLDIWRAGEDRLQLRPLERDSWINGLAVTADGNLAVSVNGSSIMDNSKNISVWDVATGCCLGILAGHNEEALSVAIPADGRHAFSVSADETLRIWNLEGVRGLGALLEHPRDLGAGALTADGQKALMAAGERGRSHKANLELWDMKTCRCLKTLKGERINKVVLTQDDRIAVTGSHADSGLIQVWNLETGSCLRRFQRECRTTVADLILSADSRMALTLIPKSVFSKDEQWNYDKHLLLLDLEKERCLKIMKHPRKVLFPAFLEDGRSAISACEDRIVRLWDLKSGLCLRSQEVSGEITALNVSPDGRWITAGTNTGHVEVWDLETRDLTGREDHTLDVSVLAATPDGHRILSGGQDGLLRLWDLENCRALRILKGLTDAVISVVVTADGQKAVSHSRDQTLRLWDLETELCLSAIRLDKAMMGDLRLKGNTILACSFSGDGEAFQIIEQKKGNQENSPGRSW
jgi:WD40 repeat protein